MGVEAGLRCVVGLGEELPFRDGTFDAVYAQGTMHHMETDLAFSECRRVLVSGGRFAAVEPCRGPLYNVGIRFFGKRDPKVQCVVLTARRVNPAVRVFDGARTIQHGAVTRYPLLALAKIGLSPSRRVLWTIGTFDDAVSSLIPRLRRTGSSVAILGTRKEQG
jgi:SAM-dependent methyltransferase